MSNTQSYEAMEADYGSDTFRRTVPVKSSKQRRPVHGRPTVSTVVANAK